MIVAIAQSEIQQIAPHVFHNFCFEMGDAAREGDEDIIRSGLCDPEHPIARPRNPLHIADERDHCAKSLRDAEE
jgi:hypothetical protein